MTYLYILLALAVIGLLYMRFEAGFVETRRVRFTKGSNGLKIIQLSDIHIPLLRVSASKVRSVIDREKPDFVVITGDYVEKPRDAGNFFKFLDKVKGDSEIFLCLGNHDYRAFKRSPEGLEKFIGDIESRGITVLHNRSVCYEKGSRKYNVIGIAEYRTQHHDVAMALEKLCSGAAANIAFSHNPDVVLAIPKSGVDYLFCGHFHGGQIWAPFDLEFKMLREDKLCKIGIKRGLHKYNGINLYINRGIGNVLVPLRFLSRPEITVFYMP